MACETRTHALSATSSLADNDGDTVLLDRVQPDFSLYAASALWSGKGEGDMRCLKIGSRSRCAVMAQLARRWGTRYHGLLRLRCSV